MSPQTESQEAKWLAAHRTLDMDLHGDRLLAILSQVEQGENMTPRDLRRILAKHPRVDTGDGRTTYSKHELVQGYRALCDQGRLIFDRAVLRRLQMKPTRTLSGVAPVTVLTKPAPCPGE